MLCSVVIEVFKVQAMSYPPGGGSMGWSHESVVGDRVVRVIFSRSGSFRRHLDRGRNPVESFRLGGRHVRMILERRPGWEQLSDEQRDVRIRETS
jgi:hypothetical protein